MSKPFYHMNPEELLPWLLNFITVARARIAELPMITVAQLDQLEDEMNELQLRLNARVAAEEAKESAVEALDAAYKSNGTKSSFFNTVIKADKSVPRELIEALGLPVSNETNRATLKTPLDLTVAPQADGNNHLKFDRNANPRAAIFIIEARIGDDPEWKYVTSTTESKFTHEGQTPGVQIAYRVKATHKGESSAWSAVAVAYFKG